MKKFILCCNGCNEERDIKKKENIITIQQQKEQEKKSLLSKNKNNNHNTFSKDHVKKNINNFQKKKIENSIQNLSESKNKIIKKKKSNNNNNLSTNNIEIHQKNQVQTINNEILKELKEKLENQLAFQLNEQKSWNNKYNKLINNSSKDNSLNNSNNLNNNDIISIVLNKNNKTKYEEFTEAIVNIVNNINMIFNNYISKKNNSESISQKQCENVLNSVNSLIKIVNETTITNNNNETSTNTSNIVSLLMSPFVKKSWSALLIDRTNHINKLTSNFISFIQKNETIKVQEYFSQLNKDISLLTKICSSLIHTSISSKEIKNSCLSIQKIIKDQEIINLLEHIPQDWGKKLLKVVIDSFGDLTKLGDFIGSLSFDTTNDNLTQEKDSINFLLNSLQKSSFQLEDIAFQIASRLEQGDIIQEQLINSAREVRGAFILFNISIKQVSENREQWFKDDYANLNISASNTSSTPLPLLQLSAATTAFSQALINLVEAATEVQKNAVRRKSIEEGISSLSLIDESSLDKSNINIWEEKKSNNIIYNINSEISSENLEKTLQIKCASLNQLIILLTSDNDQEFSPLFNKIFLTTYLSFCSPRQLFEKLIERYNGPKKSIKRSLTKISISSKQLKIIRNRILLFVKQWIDNSVNNSEDIEIDLELEKKILKFIEERASKDGFNDIIEHIRISLKKKFSDRQSTILRPTLTPESKLYSISPSRFLLEIDPVLIANHLTLIEFKLFSSIKPSELQFQSWNKPKLKYRAYRIIRMINRFNNISLWIASSIVWQYSLEDRCQVVENLIEIASNLRKLKNFNTLFAILAGLQLSSIYRLRKTFEKLQKKKQTIFNQLVELMESKASFKNYRNALNESKPPCIPYLGLYLTDLTFLDEGNPDKIDNLINFKKREKVFQIISTIQEFQKYPYDKSNLLPITNNNNQNIDEITISSFLLELPRHNKEELWNLSLLVEPRQSES